MSTDKDWRPAYRLIADELRERIVSGQIPLEGLLPSYSEISRTYNVKMPTAQKAVGILRGEGLVRTETGRGSYVIADRPATPEDPTITELRRLRAEVKHLDAVVAGLQARMDALNAAADAQADAPTPLAPPNGV